MIGDGAELVGKADPLDYLHKSSILGKATPTSRDRSDPALCVSGYVCLLVMDLQPMGSEVSSLTQFLSLKAPSYYSTGLNDHFHFGLTVADLFSPLS